MTARRLPEWLIPVGYFAAFALIALALWAVGDGRGPNAHAEEVRAARQLLANERHARSPEHRANIASALRALDPDAVEEAEREHGHRRSAGWRLRSQRRATFVKDRAY